MSSEELISVIYHCQCSLWLFLYGQVCALRLLDPNEHQLENCFLLNIMWEISLYIYWEVQT